MVYSVGGYEFRDYLTFGFPLSVIVFATTMVTLSWWYGLGWTV